MLSILPSSHRSVIEHPIDQQNVCVTRHGIICKYASNAFVIFFVFGVNFLNVPAFYFENAQNGLCKANFANFACVND